MRTRNVVITDHQEGVIGALVASGRYQSASEVLREGLRLVEQRELEDQARLAALQAAVDVGLADLDAGRYHAFADVDELMAYLAGADEGAESDGPAPSEHGG